MVTEFLRRKRLLWWLVRAYVKKRKRTIGSFFLAGVAFGAFVFFALPKVAHLLPQKTERIGIIGSYTIETLPIDLQNNVSLGLTRITEDGQASPSAALSFEIRENGKAYHILLRDDLFWQDRKKFTAFDVNYNFKDVRLEVKGEHEIVFTLKEPFSPFPTVLSQPLFRKGLIGLVGSSDLGDYGQYKISHISLNGQFVEEFTMEGMTKQTRGERKIYKFYPSEEVAKTAFMLGEIDRLTLLLDPSEFQDWKNVEVTRETSYDLLVTVFYNTSFPLLSDKSFRQALTFALPREFGEHIPAKTPLSYRSWAYVAQNKYLRNVEASKKLLAESKNASTSGEHKLDITTTAKFKGLAEQIKTAWKEIGVETNIQIVQIIPSDPQVLLERFRIPQDPDQYILWHSTQNTNISRFSSPKIDKLLEDGRQITNQDERAQIYAEFQRHIVEESPAAFLYYPTVYTVSRK